MSKLGASVPTKQVTGLDNILDSTLTKASFASKNTLLFKNNADVVTSVAIPEGALVGRNKAGEIGPITVPTNALLVNVAGTLTSVTFDDFLTTVTEGIGVNASDLALPIGKIFVGDSTGKAAAVATNNVSLSAFGAATTNIYLGTKSISSDATSFAVNDYVTKAFVTSAVAGMSDPTTLALPDGLILVGSVTNKATPTAVSTISITKLGAPTANLDFKTFTIKTTQTVFNDEDLVTKKFVTDQLASFSPSSIALPTGKIFIGDGSDKAAPASPSAIVLSAFGTPTVNVDFGSFTGKTTQTTFKDEEFVTKKYVTDSLSAFTPSAIALTNGHLFLGNGSNKATDTPKKDIPVDGFGLAANKIIVGNVSNIAAATNLSDISLSKFGTPTADINIGAFGITTTQTSFAANHLITRDFAETKLPGPGSRIVNENATLTNGSMTLITLANTPLYPTKMEVRINSHDLLYGIHYTVIGKVVSATAALNTAIGGIASDGKGFDSTDLVILSYDVAV